MSILDDIRDHMKRQPYYCSCPQCGNDLKSYCSVDSDMDISLIIEPCDVCMKEASEEARKAGEG